MNSEKFDELIENIPAFSSEVQQLLAILSDEENLSINKLSSTINRDPIISMKVLKLANSSFFSPIKPIQSVKRAVSYIGVSNLKTFLYSIALQSLGEKQKIESEKLELLKYLKNKCLANGFVAMFLAKNSNNCYLEDDIAFTYGLLHDIGYMLLAIYPENTSFISLEKYLHNPGIDSKNYMFHADLGALLLSKWKLPQTIINFTKNHESDQNSQDGAFINIVENVCFDLGYDNFYKKVVSLEYLCLKVGIKKELLSKDSLKELQKNLSDILQVF